MEITEEIRTSIQNYRRMGIDIEILEEEQIKITQKRLVNGYMLNQKQLVDRAREVFEASQSRIIPVIYSIDLSEIDIHWVKTRMGEFGIKRKDLIKQMAIDKSSLSLFLSGKRGMDKSQRAAFYYYFQTYELNRSFREYMEHY